MRSCYHIKSFGLNAFWHPKSSLCSHSYLSFSVCSFFLPPPSSLSLALSLSVCHSLPVIHSPLLSSLPFPSLLLLLYLVSFSNLLCSGSVTHTGPSWTHRCLLSAGALPVQVDHGAETTQGAMQVCQAEPGASELHRVTLPASPKRYQARCCLTLPSTSSTPPLFSADLIEF